MRSLLILLALPFALACSQRVAASTDAISSSVSSISYSKRSSPGLVAPGIPPVPSGLVVRPDTAVFPIGFHARYESCAESMAAIEKAAASLSERLTSEIGNAATLRLRTLDVAELHGGYKFSSKDAWERDGKPIRGRSDGVIEVALASNADYWTRMKLLVKVADIVSKQFPVEVEPKTPPALEVVLGGANLRVQDPEKHRDALTQAWSKRVREFIAAAQGPGAKLLLTSCEPPGDIVQQPLSLEEVSLQLPVSCRLGVTETTKQTP